MKIVNSHLAHSIKEQGMIKPPNSYGYIQLAAEVELPRPFLSNSASKKTLLAELKVLCGKLKSSSASVRRVDLFDAFIIPPGANPGLKLIDKNGYDVHLAKFDIVLLIECSTVDDALTLRDSSAFKEIEQVLHDKATYTHSMVAKNANRIDEVSKDSNGIFLFNYFYAEDTQTLLDVWEYTAGWWTAKANLTNSTPIQPVEAGSQYNLINHCRWDKLIDVLPSLIFKPGLNNFVLKNFTVNNIVAMPILYKLV
ncbi:MAG: hypothetical protein DHS20C09_12200 [marine bacterium B5-7]|nr:MAG: hypothetical protein DHS20C09_12200 [marine bacterium B5-7]